MYAVRLFVWSFVVAAAVGSTVNRGAELHEQKMDCVTVSTAPTVLLRRKLASCGAILKVRPRGTLSRTTQRAVNEVLCCRFPTAAGRSCVVLDHLSASFQLRRC